MPAYILTPCKNDIIEKFWNIHSRKRSSRYQYNCSGLRNYTILPIFMLQTTTPHSGRNQKKTAILHLQHIGVSNFDKYEVTHRSKHQS